jgi:hypothetical protein
MDEPPTDLPPPALTVRRGPGPMMRFIAAVSGVLMFGLGRAVQQSGGVVAIVIGVLIELVAVAVVVIAVGAVEWFVRRRARPGR